MALANVPMDDWMAGLLAPTSLASPAGPQAEQRSPLAHNQKPRARTGCPSCGVVEAIRQFDAVGALPAGYEFTVRFRDGSKRVSTHAHPASWRIGDSILLIGGAKPSAITQAPL